MEINHKVVNEIYQLRTDIQENDLKERFGNRLEQLKSMIVILSTDFNLEDTVRHYVNVLLDLIYELSFIHDELNIVNFK